MDNFNLRKYLAENKLRKNSPLEEMHITNQERYNYDKPNSPISKLNNNDQDVAILNNMTKEYGLDVVVMWLSSGECGDQL